MACDCTSIPKRQCWSWEWINNYFPQKSMGCLDWYALISHKWYAKVPRKYVLTHWGRVTHICVSKLTIIGSDNGLPPGRRRAIIWTNDGILSIGPLGANFNEISTGIQTFSFKKMHIKMSSAKYPFCLGLNVLINHLLPWCYSPDYWYHGSTNLTHFIYKYTRSEVMIMEVVASSKSWYWLEL